MIRAITALILFALVGFSMAYHVLVTAKELHDERAIQTEQQQEKRKANRLKQCRARYRDCVED